MASYFCASLEHEREAGVALVSFDLASLVRRAFVVVLLVYVGVGSGCWGPFVLVVPLVLVVLYAFVLEP